jgi:hypothetical protein
MLDTLIVVFALSLICLSLSIYVNFALAGIIQGLMIAGATQHPTGFGFAQQYPSRIKTKIHERLLWWAMSRGTVKAARQNKVN